MFTLKVSLHPVTPGIFSALSLAAANVSNIAHASEFETILSCDDEAVILQTNRAERRNYQLVVKDPNIITYFLGQGAFRNAGTNFGNGRELIVGGYLQNGVFSPDDFSRAAGGYNYGDSFEISRDGDGLKLKLRSIAHYDYCDGTVSRDYGTCNGTYRTSTIVHEYGDWFFRRCE